MRIKKPLGTAALIVIILVIAGVAFAGTIYFYILPNHSGSYSGPGLPNPGMTTSYSVSIPNYGDWTTYAFHANTTNFWANVTSTGLGGSYQTVAFGLMNQSDYNNLSSNTSISWVKYQAPGDTDFSANWQLTSSGNYYIVWIQEGNGNFQNSGTLDLTQI